MQFKLGLDTTAKILTSLDLTTTSEYTGEVGQTLLSDFEAGCFEVKLDVQKGSPRGTRVTNLVEFFVLVQLSEVRLPMKLELETEATSKAFFKCRSNVILVP